MDTEEIFLEPSACAGFAGVSAMAAQEEFQKYVKEHGLEPVMENAVQIVWATGGSWCRKRCAGSIWKRHGSCH